MQASTEIVDDYLHIHAVQRNFEKSLFDGYTYEELDDALKQASKDDFTEIFYECFADQAEKIFIKLEPVGITFYDYALHYDFNSFEVDGDGFINLMSDRK